MALSKGIKLLNVRSFVEERLGPAAWRELQVALPVGDRTRLETVDAASWYESEVMRRLTVALWRRRDDDSYALMRALGRFEAERELATVHRWFVPLIDPWRAVGNMDLYWRRAHDTGSWQSQVRGDEITATLADWSVVEPACCHRVLGYLGRTLELFGAGVGALEHPACRAHGAPACAFRTRFERAFAPPRHDLRMRLADVPLVGRELAQCVDVDALADALVTLFRAGLGCSRVALWLDAAPGAPPRLARAGGAAAHARRFVLAHAGRVVGHLELGREHAWDDARDGALVESLVPLVALALDRLSPAPGTWPRATPGTGTPAAGAEGLAGRLERARTRWSLTRRQTEVLGLLVQGRTNREIAAALGCREGTVEVHVSGLLGRCGAENRAALTAMFWAT